MTASTLPVDIEKLTREEALALFLKYFDETQKLQHQLAQLKRAIFGQKQERFVAPPPEQTNFNELLVTQKNYPIPAFTESREKITYERRKPSGHGRKPIPDDLHREIHIIDVAESDKVCACGNQKKHIGDDITEELEYKPAVLFVNRYVRPKYACPRCPDKGVTTGLLPPRPIDKGIAGTGLISYVLISKHVDHLPLYRLEQIFKRYNIHINRSTMVGWLESVCGHLESVYRSLHRQLIEESHIIQADETPLKVHHEEQQRNITLGYLWPFVGDGRIAVFDFREGRGRDGPTDFLSGYHGYLQTDGYAGYNLAIDSHALQHLACWAHVRRKFFEAKDIEPELAEVILTKIGTLYDIERAARKQHLSYDQRRCLRHDAAPLILVELKQLLDDPGKIITPKNPMAQAIEYAKNFWAELTEYLVDGRLELDNNRVENLIRPVALGRKNWLFAGSPQGARRLAIIYSLIATCKLNDVNPYEYFVDILPKIAGYPSQKIADLTPINWKMSKSA